MSSKIENALVNIWFWFMVVGLVIWALGPFGGVCK